MIFGNFLQSFSDSFRFYRAVTYTKWAKQKMDNREGFRRITPFIAKKAAFKRKWWRNHFLSVMLFKNFKSPIGCAFSVCVCLNSPTTGSQTGGQWSAASQFPWRPVTHCITNAQICKHLNNRQMEILLRSFFGRASEKTFARPKCADFRTAVWTSKAGAKISKPQVPREWIRDSHGMNFALGSLLVNDFELRIWRVYNGWLAVLVYDRTCSAVRFVNIVRP